MSEHSSGRASGTVPLCKKCNSKSPLRYDIICSSCGCFGDDETNVRRCKQCYGYMYEDSSICLWCDHNRAFPVSKKPCILCCNLLPLIYSVCGTCRTPQDMDVLKGQLFKKCLNSSCSAIVNIHASNCYQCEYQQDPSISGIDLFSSGVPSYLQTQLQANSFYNPTTSSPPQNVHHDTSSSAAERKVENTSVESKAVREKCVFCENSFSECLEKCNACSALQDVDILKTLQFNNCTSGCGAILCVKFHNFCFRCEEKQEYPLNTFSGMEVFLPSKVPNPSLSVENLVSSLPQDEDSAAKKFGSAKPLKKPCILCSTEIPASSTHCFTCQTTQIEDALKHSRFKLCSNAECKAPMPADSTVCYRCKQDQYHIRATFPTKSMLCDQIFSSTCTDSRSHGESSMTGKERGKEPCVVDANSYDILDSTEDSGNSQSQSQVPNSACDKSVGNTNITKSKSKSHDKQHDDGENDKGVNGGMNASSDLQNQSEQSKNSVNNAKKQADALPIPQNQSNQRMGSKETSGPGEKPQKVKALQKQPVSYSFYAQGVELIILFSF